MEAKLDSALERPCRGLPLAIITKIGQTRYNPSTHVSHDSSGVLPISNIRGEPDKLRSTIMSIALCLSAIHPRGLDYDDVYSVVESIPPEVLITTSPGMILCTAHRQTRDDTPWSRRESVDSQDLHDLRHMVGSTFDAKEICLTRLKKVGKLSVEWSFDIERHLLLKTRKDTSRTILLLYWPCSTILHGPASFSRYDISF